MPERVTLFLSDEEIEVLEFIASHPGEFEDLPEILIRLIQHILMWRE